MLVALPPEVGEDEEAAAEEVGVADEAFNDDDDGDSDSEDLEGSSPRVVLRG